MAQHRQPGLLTTSGKRNFDLKGCTFDPEHVRITIDYQHGGDPADFKVTATRNGTPAKVSAAVRDRLFSEMRFSTSGEKPYLVSL